LHSAGRSTWRGGRWLEVSIGEEMEGETYLEITFHAQSCDLVYAFPT
jgi:hypothetical protein